MTKETLRKTGRTTKMIESIPNPEEYAETARFFIVGTTIAQANIVIKTAEKLRPELKGKLVPVAAAKPSGLDPLNGIWSDLIFVDNAVYDAFPDLPIETQAWLKMFATLPDMTEFLEHDTVAQEIKHKNNPAQSKWQKIKNKIVDWFACF